MIGILIDTSVLIEYSRGESSKLIDLIKKQDNSKLKLFTSTLTVFEFYCGIDQSESKALEYTNILFSLFEVIDINNEISIKAGKFYKENPITKNIGVADLLIGATAITYNLKLLTLNTKHYKLMQPLGLDLL